MHFSSKLLCSASEQDPCGYSGQAHTAVASNTASCSADQCRGPGGTAESGRQQLDLPKKGSTAGRQVRAQIHCPEGNHRSAAEAVEGATRANRTADREAEYERFGAGDGENRTAHPGIAAGRLKTRDLQWAVHRGGVGLLQSRTM